MGDHEWETMGGRPWVGDHGGRPWMGDHAWETMEITSRKAIKNHVGNISKTLIILFFLANLDRTFLHVMIQHIILPQIGLSKETKNKMPYRGPIVFGKRHTGGPLCSDPMIQNIILPQICLPQHKIKKCHTGGPLCLGNAIQGAHCVPTGDHGRPCKKH